MSAGPRIYGVHAVRTLLGRRPAALKRAWVLDGEHGERLAALIRALESRGVPTSRVARRELDRLTNGAAHQGIAVDAAAPGEVSLTDFEELVISRGSDARVLVLDGVEDPRNLGACLRTADAAGIDALIVPRSRAARVTPAAAKVATGAAETVPVLHAPSFARTLRWLKDAGLRLVGADSAGRRSLFDARLAPPIALVLGGEGRGVSRSTRELCDELVAIPMYGSVESLNVSVAAALMMYELARQARPALPDPLAPSA